jgi:NAD(P)-dependent dehydrogenase (short-subunit alcohol dehydrogenase family)
MSNVYLQIEDLNSAMKGLTALVTGGSSGIGLAAARLFCEAGANVVVVGRQLSKLRSASEVLIQYKEAVHFITGDVSSEGYANKIVVDTKRKFGSLDILVNCAGVFTGGSILKMSEEDFDYVVGVNLKGSWFMCKFAARIMSENQGGAIVNVASTLARAGYPKVLSSTYAASKAGVLGLTHALAAELAPKIRVNCVVPGWVESPILDLMRESNELQEGDSGNRGAAIPTAEDVAVAILELANPLRPWITGQEITIDGARSLIG